MPRHPGRILEDDFLQPLGLCASQLARGLGVHRSTVHRLLSGELRIGRELAARLGAFFQVPAKWWLLMQAEFDAEYLQEHPELQEGVKPLALDPSLLVTPSGVLSLGDNITSTPDPLSVSYSEATEQAQPLPTTQRTAKLLRYENGSLALVGDAS